MKSKRPLSPTSPSQDDLIKNLLIQPRLLLDFLRAFLPEIFDFTDFEVLEYLDKEHPRSKGKPRRRGDLLLKVRWRGRDAMFLIHIESQGQPQDTIVERTAEYCFRDSIQFRLPVMPLVLLTYTKPQTPVAGTLDWQFGGMATIHVRCPVLHFSTMDPTPYLKSKNIAALAMSTLMKLKDDQQVDAIVQTMAEAMRQGLSPDEEAAALEFATSVVELSQAQLLQLEEKVTILAKQEKRLIRMPKLINPFIELGKLKGRQEGRQEGESVVVMRLLGRKFPALPQTLINKVRKFDEETLLSFGDALLFWQNETECRRWIKDQVNR
jgi:Domain of unknown function (DUF4351)